MERGIKVNELFGFAVLAPYFKLLSMNEMPCYDTFDALIQVSSSEMNVQLNEIIQDASFDAYPTKLKSQILINVSRAADQYNYVGNFDV